MDRARYGAHGQLGNVAFRVEPAHLKKHVSARQESANVTVKREVLCRKGMKSATRELVPPGEHGNTEHAVSPADKVPSNPLGNVKDSEIVTVWVKSQQFAMKERAPPGEHGNTEHAVPPADKVPSNPLGNVKDSEIVTVWVKRQQFAK